MKKMSDSKKIYEQVAIPYKSGIYSNRKENKMSTAMGTFVAIPYKSGIYSNLKSKEKQWQKKKKSRNPL